MKKTICILLAGVLLLGLCACANTDAGAGTSAADTTQKPQMETQETIDPNTPLCDGKTLKILTISSSFGLNTTEFLYEVAKAQGATDITIGRLFLAECTLGTHVDNIRNNANVYTYYKKNSDQPWDIITGADILYGLQDEQWDIIFLQHSAAGAAMIDTYNDPNGVPYLDTMFAYINENKTNPNARFVWNMTWAYPNDSTSDIYDEFDRDQVKMYEEIVKGVQQHILPRTEFARIIPSGTAIQNVRTSYYGDTLNKDGLHLNELGSVIAGYMTYVALTDQPLTSIELTNIRTTVILTDEDKATIMEAVNAAYENPYQITQSSHPTRG